MSFKRVEILKIPIDTLTLKNSRELIISWSQSNSQKHITTPNPEIILKSLKNKKLKSILKSTSLNTPDGIGLLWAAKYLQISKKNKSKFLKALKCLYSLFKTLFSKKYIQKPIAERVTGSDLILEICKHCPKLKTKIFLLGAAPGIAATVKDKLQKKYKGIKVSGIYAGSPHENEEEHIINMINSSKANILFVAYGAPAQEIWINKNLKKMRNVKVAMGIGGAFDFIAQKRKRAPNWVQKVGFEWLFRLIQEPTRIKRIFSATIKFPYIVWKKS